MKRNKTFINKLLTIRKRTNTLMDRDLVLELLKGRTTIAHQHLQTRFIPITRNTSHKVGMR